MSGSFMSVTDLATARGVSKQAISKTLARHAGLVATRKDGVRLLVDVDAFDRVTGNDTDPAQMLRNRAVAPSAQVRQSQQSFAQQPDPPQRMPGGTAHLAYSVSRAKRETYEADLARISLDKEMGKLVPVTQVTDAMVACGQKLVRMIDQLPAKSEDPAVRKILKEVAAELRREMYESMKLTADAADAAEAGEDEDGGP